MPLLDRYLFTQFIKNFLMVLCALTSIYFLVDFFERVDNFMESQKSLGLAMKYFFLKIPFMMDMIYPVCILLAGVVTMGLLHHNREFLALKAGGISVLRISRPLMAASLLLTLGAVCMAEWVLPDTLAETNRIWYEDLHNRIPKGVARKGWFYHRGDKGIYTFIRSNPKTDFFRDFSYTEWDDQYSATLHLFAKTAAWQDGTWTFAQGRIKRGTIKEGVDHAFTFFTKTSLDLPETPAEFFIPEYKSDEQSISQLFEHALQSEEGNTLAWTELHSRLSFLLLGLPLTLLGLAILLVVQRKWGRDLALAIPISCGMAFAAWGWWSTAQSMAKAAYLPPAVAAWSVHLLIGGLGLWLLKRQDT